MPTIVQQRENFLIYILASSQLTYGVFHRLGAALCRVILLREGALNASVAILVQPNGLESKLTSYALKTVTLFAQNQFRTSAHSPAWQTFADQSN